MITHDIPDGTTEWRGYPRFMVRYEASNFRILMHVRHDVPEVLSFDEHVVWHFVVLTGNLTLNLHLYKKLAKHFQSITMPTMQALRTTKRVLQEVLIDWNMGVLQ